MRESQPTDQFEINACIEDTPNENSFDIAEIEIKAAGSYLTTLYDADEGRRRTFLRASATALAVWLARNWWRLNYEPLPNNVEERDVNWRLSHELTSISQDTIWPPITIYGDGSVVNISPRLGKSQSLGPISYETFSTKFVRSETFRSALDAFFEKVCEIFDSTPITEALRSQLRILQSDRDNAEFSAWRRLEAQLGYDCGEAPDGLMIHYSKLADIFGEAAIGEAASATPGPTSASIMENAVKAARSGIAINREAFRGEPVAKASRFSYPWLAAETQAARVRKALNVSEGPISSKVLGDLLNVDFETAREAPAAQHLPYGAIVADGRREHIALNSWPHAVPRRFELARALGDATWESVTTFVAISAAKTERQKYQRAFAQSFLCPFSSLQEYIGTDTPTDDAINAASTHFRVSERLIRTLLVNKRVLPRDALLSAYETI